MYCTFLAYIFFLEFLSWRIRNALIFLGCKLVDTVSWFTCPQFGTQIKFTQINLTLCRYFLVLVLLPRTNGIDGGPTTILYLDRTMRFLRAPQFCWIPRSQNKRRNYQMGWVKLCRTNDKNCNLLLTQVQWHDTIQVFYLQCITTCTRDCIEFECNEELTIVRIAFHNEINGITWYKFLLFIY